MTLSADSTRFCVVKRRNGAADKPQRHRRNATTADPKRHNGKTERGQGHYLADVQIASVGTAPHAYLIILSERADGLHFLFLNSITF